MSFSHSITFIDDSSQECSALAMSVANTLTTGKSETASAIFQTNGLPRSAFGLAQVGEIQTFSCCDVLIGLCFGYVQENGLPLDKCLKNLGIERQFAMVAYWDLSHLVRDESANFMEKLRRELEQRIGLLVGARF